jgi:eukaryotic-like serine/threonine-protein kinase
VITLEAGRTIAGKYQLERPLAKGGMGAVWVARHVLLDVVVAVKFMDPEAGASEEARVRFEREAKASAQLKSPNVVQVHDYGIEDGTPYLVMELLDGEDLGARLRREVRMSLRAASALLTQLGKGLRRAHEAGIVHRDLKPSNIFLQKQDEDIVVKILDFGIAKSIVPNKPLVGDATKTGLAIGSPPFMSPEQLRNSKGIDHRTDLWSVGVILFQCLTGRLPFQADDLTSLILCICMEPIPVPSEIALDLGPEVDRFFERALARDLSQRFQSVKELVDAFAALPGARMPSAADWSDSGSLSPLVPGPAHAAAAAPMGPAVPGSLKLDSGASGALPAPHVVAVSSPDGGDPGNAVSATNPSASGEKRRRTLAAAIGVASVAAAIGLTLFLRVAGTQPPSLEGTPEPSRSAGEKGITEGRPLPAPEPPTATAKTPEPSITPLSPAASVSTSSTAPTAAPSGVAGKPPSSSTAKRPSGGNAPTKQDAPHSILGF